MNSLMSVSAAASVGFVAGLLIERFRKRKSLPQKTAGGKSSDDDDSSEDDDVPEDDELRILLAVRQDLKMGKGKIGAQCGHAALGAYKQAMRRWPERVRRYDRTGQTKIALKINDLQQMKELSQAAEAISVPTYMVIDAGRTQIPAHSATVLALGPAPKRLLSTITSHLKLL